MTVDLRELPFGVEIEFTGITRKKAAQVCAACFHTEPVKYNENLYVVRDETHREWKFVYDSSITAKPSGNPYKVEMVTPVCRYEDIERIQEIVRALRNEGLRVNDSCGMHIHVDGSRFDPRTLRNLVNLMANKEDVIYRALNVNARRERNYCRKTNPVFLEELNRAKPTDMEEFRRIWYQDQMQRQRHGHYDESRYQSLNLHSFFEKGTVEYRVFNGTSHCGRIRTAIQFVLAITAQALNRKYVTQQKMESENEKYTFRTWLLSLGMIGPEFKTARMFLRENLEGNSAWKDPVQAQLKKEAQREARRLQEQQAESSEEMEETMEMQM